MADGDLAITEGGVTVTVRPLGWSDYWGLDRELDRIATMPTGTPDEDAALVAACLALGERMDAYAVPGSLPPSRVPVASMRAFVARWTAGVRDAAVPPPSGGTSPSGRRGSSRSRPR